jgi:adenylate cyclase
MTSPSEPFSVSPMFDRLGIWLMEQGLREADVDEVVQGFGQRLVTAGVPLYRLSLGGILLHPVFGALDVVWDADKDTLVSQQMPRDLVATEDFRDSPFFWRHRTTSITSVLN